MLVFDIFQLICQTQVVTHIAIFPSKLPLQTRRDGNSMASLWKSSNLQLKPTKKLLIDLLVNLYSHISAITVGQWFFLVVFRWYLINKSCSLNPDVKFCLLLWNYCQGTDDGNQLKRVKMVEHTIWLFGMLGLITIRKS